MRGTVLTALKTICPGELLTTPRGCPCGQALEVAAAWVNFCFTLERALECEGRGLGDPPPHTHRPVSPERTLSAWSLPPLRLKSRLLGLLRMGGSVLG